VCSPDAAFQVTPFAFLILFTLAGFNGYITAHLAVGHSMWGGFFLLPFFALEALSLAEEKTSPGVITRMALVLFGMLLQDSFHMFIWCCMFLAFMAAGHQLFGGRQSPFGGALYRSGNLDWHSQFQLADFPDGKFVPESPL
jgi:hypothetical protein